jgi:hypothetical protein
MGLAAARARRGCCAGARAAAWLALLLRCCSRPGCLAGGGSLMPEAS